MRHHAQVLGHPVPLFSYRNRQSSRRLRDARPQGHMRAPCVVMPHPFVQKAPQMVFRQRNQKIQTLASQRPKQGSAKKWGD